MGYEIYERIRNLREDKDWTQQCLADLLFINRRTYCAYENGIHEIPMPILVRLAQIHETSVDYLLNRTDIPDPYPRK